MATATVRAFILVLILTSTASATWYHATPSGAGTHSGADLSNAKSFTEAMYADEADSVWLRAGTYPYVFSPAYSGSAAGPIVFWGYPGETVTIAGAPDGSPLLVSITGSYVELHDVNLISAEHPNYVEEYSVSISGSHSMVKGCNLVRAGDVVAGWNSGYRTRGIVVSGTYNVVDSNYVRGMCQGIVSAGGSPRFTRITRNRVNSSVWNGLLGLATDDGSTNYVSVYIGYNRIDTCWGEDCFQQQQNYDGTPNPLRSRGWYVDGNIMLNSWENAIDLKGGGHTVIQRNVMFTADGDDDGIFSPEYPSSGSIFERGNPQGGVEDQYTLSRGNVIGDGSSGRTMATVGSQSVNDLYVNNRRRLRVSNVSDSTYTLYAVQVEGNSAAPRAILNNIMVGQPNQTYIRFWNMENRATDIFTIDNNLYYDSAVVARFFHRINGIERKVYGLANWKTALSASEYSYMIGRDQHSISADPLFTDMPLRASGYDSTWDWSLSAGSPAIGAARCWTFANGSGSGSSSLVVENPYLFCDGFGITQGDSIYIHGAARLITSINYSTSTLTLSASHTWSDNDSVWLYTNGAKVTNLGPYMTAATTSGGTDPGGPPSTPVTLGPANGSTRSSPVTFSWNRVSGAVSYQLCVSPDSWGTLLVNQTGITDTFYTASLPSGGSYVWNMRASNTYGSSGWSDDWTFITTDASLAPRDTIEVSWNRVSDTRTIDSSTVVTFRNLQRRDTWLLLRNPNAAEVSWPSVTWVTAPPPAITPASAWFIFYYGGGDTVNGAYMNAIGSNLGTTWDNILGNISGNTALSTALNAKADNLTNTTLVDSAGAVSRAPDGTPRHIIVYDVNNDGNITKELQGAINLAVANTTVELIGGEYDLDTALTVPTDIPGTRGFLTIKGNNSSLRVRNGYTGSFFEPAEAVRRVTLEDFNVYEDVRTDTAKHLWTGIKLIGQTTNDGHQWNLFRNLYLEDCGVGIDLRVDTLSSWVNANQFVDIKIIRPVRMIRSRLPSGSSNWYLIDGNTFTRIEGQSKYMTVVGIDSLEGIYNSLYECTIYDLGEWNPSASAMSIGTKSANTLVWRGQLDYPRYVDNGVRTVLMSSYIGTEGITTLRNNETWNRLRVDNFYPTRKVTFGYDTLGQRPNPDSYIDEGQAFQDSAAGLVIVGKYGTKNDFTLLNNKDSRDTVLSVKRGLKDTYLHGDLHIKSISGGNNPSIWFDSAGVGRFHITYTLATNKLSISDGTSVRMQFDQGGSVAWVATHYFSPDATFDIGFAGANRPRRLFLSDYVNAPSAYFTTALTLPTSWTGTLRAASGVVSATGPDTAGLAANLWSVNARATNEQDFRRAGQWTSNSMTGIANTTQGGVNGRIYVSPLIVRETFTTDSIFTEVVVAGASANTVAIYNDSSVSRAAAPAYPMTQLWLGTRDTNSAGMKSHSLSASPLTLYKGQLYWVAFAMGNNTPTVRAVPIAAVPAVLGSNPAGGANTQYVSFYVARTYDQYLPNPFPSGGTGYSAVTSPPLLLFHVKSVP